jgi:uncharacterized membrane protein (Fun14 family)
MNENTSSPLPALPRWKKLLLGLALGLGISGALLYFIAPENPPAEPVPAQQSDNTFRAQSFAAPLNPPLAGESESIHHFADDILRMTDWSAFLMKLGFSFVVGFSVGYAAAGFLRLTLFVFGSVCLILFGLQYAGLIQVNWAGMEGLYDTFIAWLKPHIGSFKDFITSNLSSSALAGAGLFVGFKK